MVIGSGHSQFRARRPLHSSTGCYESAAFAWVWERPDREALRQIDNNQTQLAKLLGFSRDQLRYRMERYKLL